MANTIHTQTAQPEDAASVDDRPAAREPGTGAEVVWTATGHERPVFLDERGRRRRWVLAGGAIAGVACTLWLCGVLAGAIGFTSLPLPRPYARPAIERSALAADALRDRRALAVRDTDARPARAQVHLEVALPTHLRTRDRRS